MGPWLLVFFAVVTLASVGLIGWRGDELRSPGEIDHPVSREGAFLANNVLFGALAFVVLLGTVFPLVAESWNGTRLTIGRPYFDSLGRPLGLALLFLMAAAPALPWRKASSEVVLDRLFWPAVLGVVSMAAALVLGGRGFLSVAAFGLAGFAGGAALRQLVLACRRSRWRGLVGRTNGGMIVHLGVVALAFGLTASESYRSDRTVTLEPGERVTVEGRELRYLEAGADLNDRRLRTFALIEIDGGVVYAPAITSFRRSGVVVPTPSVRSGPTEDIFLVLDELSDSGSDSIRLRVIVRPMVAWIWAGGILMAVGSVLSLIPTSRPRLRRRPAVTADPSPDPKGHEAEPVDEPERTDRELVGD